MELDVSSVTSKRQTFSFRQKANDTIKSIKDNAEKKIKDMRFHKSCRITYQDESIDDDALLRDVIKEKNPVFYIEADDKIQQSVFMQ